MSKKIVQNGNVFRHGNFANVKPATPTGARTLLEVFKDRLKSGRSDYFLGSIRDGKLIYEANEEFDVRIGKLSSFLKTITKEGDFLGIYSVNRAEWVAAEYAGYMCKCPNVPLYSTFQPEAIKYVLEETQMSVLIASSDKSKSLIENVLTDSVFNLKHLILMDDNEEVKELFTAKGIEIYSLQDIFRNDEVSVPSSNERGVCQSKDLATICYTSGTSGMPKGVILTHENFIFHLSGFCNGHENDLPKLSNDSVYISYLPLAHVFERICFCIAVMTNCKIGFFRGDVKLLQNDYSIIKPTFMAAVPRVLNIFEEKIRKEVSKKNFIVRGIFKLGMMYKQWRQKHGVFKTPILDKLIFKKVAIKFGGNLENCLCGGSSINPETVSFIQAALCMRIFQGYGSSEGLAANIVQPLSYIETDTVGIPFPSTEIRLQPVDDYPADCGEILMKGLSITSGYYKQPEKSQGAFLIDGEDKWLKTGDVGRFANDKFYIVGRVKDLFKTSYGEYISPEYLENSFQGGIIDDIFITTHRYSNSLLAIINSSDINLTKEKALEEIKRRGIQLANEKKINKYEIPTNVIISKTPFNLIDNGNLITPSFKKRRDRIFKYFEDKIQAELGV